ncbi:recombinase family protein [Streptosporangium sp. NPDC006007]|uniref:recombinase family protein n=1 Tax=Streptosporangium sp. NPDC006007 TaxID=3154575 RepID=UPI0033B750DB
MKPLIYGYLRAPDETPDDELDRLVSELQRFAEAEGFCYATTFFECQEGSRSAFEELVAELTRAEARHVVVPSLEHLSGHRLLCGQMIERLECVANACVLTPDSA